jgi:hypothetical protein
MGYSKPFAFITAKEAATTLPDFCSSSISGPETIATLAASPFEGDPSARLHLQS